MGHHHGHHSNHTSHWAFAIAVTLTLGYTAIETAYGFKAHSMSLLADAVHNLGDSLGLVLAWLANWLLSLPAKKRFSYGYKRTTIYAALANAFILVGTSMVIGYESIRKLFHIMPVEEHLVITVGLIGIIVNAGCSLLFMRNAHHDLNIKGAFLHLLADALILGGVVLSAAIIAFTGWEWIDPVVGLLIVAIVLWGSWSLLRDALSLIMDAIPHYIDHQGVREYLETYPGVKELHDLHIWGLSTRETALTAHLVIPDGNLTDQDHKTINQHLLKTFSIHHVTLQAESGCDIHPCEISKSC